MTTNRSLLRSRWDRRPRPTTRFRTCFLKSRRRSDPGLNLCGADAERVSTRASNTTLGIGQSPWRGWYSLESGTIYT